jgi:hypothetical protein
MKKYSVGCKNLTDDIQRWTKHLIINNDLSKTLSIATSNICVPWRGPTISRGVTAYKKKSRKD